MGKRIMKTPEELAVRYSDLREFADRRLDYKAKLLLEQGFLAGYQAAKDQLADTSKVMADENKFVARTVPMYGLATEKWNSSDTIGGLLNKSAANHALGALAKKTSSQWISVKERLPEYDVDVLTIEDGEMEVNAVSEYTQWWWSSDEGFERNPTHWQPLPEPPKEEK
jgi:hypothetical protein